MTDEKNVQQWSLPTVGDAGGGYERRQQMAANNNFEQNKQQGYQAGFSEGQAAAQASVDQRLAQISQLIELLESPLKQVDANLENELMALVVALTKHLLKCEITAQPDKIMPVIKDMLNSLPIINKTRLLYLNEEDKQIVDTALQNNTLSLTQCQIQVDTSLSRGEYRLETDSGDIDATIQTMLTSIADRVLLTEKNNDDN